MVLQNVRNDLPNDTALRFRRLESSATPLWKPQISHWYQGMQSQNQTKSMIPTNGNCIILWITNMYMQDYTVSEPKNNSLKLLTVFRSCHLFLNYVVKYSDIMSFIKVWVSQIRVLILLDYCLSLPPITLSHVGSLNVITEATENDNW